MLRASKFFFFIIILAIFTLNFQKNYFNVASFNQFSTIKDGSEALVVGNILADAIGINTGNSNLGFVQLNKVSKDSGVFAAYKRIEFINGVFSSDISDEYWLKGFNRNNNSFIVDRVTSSKVGYEISEFYSGQNIVTPDGISRIITEVQLGEQYITVFYSGSKVNISILDDNHTIEIFNREFSYQPYFQQYGIQAELSGLLYNTFKSFKNIESLQLVFSLLTSVIIILVAYEISLSFSWLFSFCFLIILFLSPQIVGFARNLYWTVFLWFLPLYFSLLSFRFRKVKFLSCFFIFSYASSVALKCLSGYEYLTCILILSAFIYFVAPFVATNNYTFRQAFIDLMKLIAASLIGFMVAVIIHSNMRAESFLDGLHDTVGFDAIKYLPVASDVNYNNATSIYDVLKLYFFNWRVPFIYPFESLKAFPVMFFASLASLIIIGFINRAIFFRDFILLAVTFLVPISWYVVMAGHAKIHIHLDFVLMYLGFAPALLFIIIDATYLILRLILFRFKAYKTIF